MLFCAMNRLRHFVLCVLLFWMNLHAALKTKPAHRNKWLCKIAIFTSGILCVSRWRHAWEATTGLKSAQRLIYWKPFNSPLAAYAGIICRLQACTVIWGSAGREMSLFVVFFSSFFFPHCTSVSVEMCSEGNLGGGGQWGGGELERISIDTKS